MSRCKSCGATVVWGRTRAGAKMPLDTPSVPDGSYVLDGGLARPVELFDSKDRPRFVPHWASCPDADAWRGPK